MADRAKPTHRHEGSDINARAIAGFAILMVFLAVFLHIFLWWLFDLFGRQYGNVPVPIITEQQLPPEPRLQTSPRTDWDRMFAETERRLHSYGWADQPGGAVHIPIEQAMRSLANQGLPYQPLPSDQTGETTVPILTESGYATH